jgi:hypothetical protein
MEELKTSDMTEAEKIAVAFGHVTGSILDYGRHEIDLAKAMSDREAVIKRQIKVETIKHARGIFEMCYKMMTGKEPWDEQTDG